MTGKKSAGQPARREMSASTGGRDITRGYIDPLSMLAPQDTILWERAAGDLARYEEILSDDQVAATFQQRRLAAVGCPWDVTPGADDAVSRQAAEFIEETLDHIRWDNVTDKMLYGVFYGFAVAECLWARDGARVILDGVRVRKQRRFAFAADGGLRLLTTENPVSGEKMPERKFWTFSTGADNDDEPYGLGLGHWLYWPTYFKKGGVRAWSRFLDKFGMPTAKGTFPATATKPEIDRLLDALESIQSSAGIALPESMGAELLEAVRSGRASYAEFIDRMNAAIAKVVLSQTLTTDAVGGQYKAGVQKEVRNEVVRADSDLICTSFNRSVVRWLCEWNFPGAALPRVSRQVEEPEDLTIRAQRDRLLVPINDPRFQLPREYLEEVYGLQLEEVAVDRDGAGDDSDREARFAEGGDGQSLIDALGENLDPATLQSQADGLLKPVLKLLRTGADPETVLEQLAGLYPSMDDAGLEAMLERHLFIAETLGRLEVGNDRVDAG